MADGKPTVHSMLKDAITNLGGTVTHRQIIDWINGKYNDVNERTIRAHIEMASVNMRGRVGMPQNSKPREHDERYDLLFSIGKGEVELYNPTKHGKWSLMETRNGKTVIAKDGVPSEGDTDSYRHLQNSEFEKIKRFCLEELPSPDRNYREIALKKLLDDENFIITKDVVGESVSKLNPEGNPAYKEPKLGYKRAACEMILEYLVKPARQGLVPIVKDQGDSYSLILSTSTKKEQVNELKSICGKAIANRHVTELMKEDNQYWFIQAGRKDEQKIKLEKFRKGSYVAVDYYEDCDFDLSGMTDNEIDTKTGGNKVRELFNISQIKQGDFIAVVKGNKTVEEFAIATSDYYFVVSDTERDKHRVNVEYLNFGTTKFGKNWNAAIMQDTSGKIKNFLLGENEPQYFLLRHGLKGPWKDDPGKTYHVGRNKVGGKMGNLVEAIRSAGVGTKTVWWTASGRDVYFWGYGTISKIETITEDKDWNLKYDNFKFFEGDVDIQGRKLKKATEFVNQQIHDLEDNSKETGFNWRQSINRIPKKIYEEITGDRSTMSAPATENLDSSEYQKTLENDLNLLFYGPPGTGKTFLAEKLAKSITSNQVPAETAVELKPPTWLGVAAKVLLDNNGTVTNYHDIAKLATQFHDTSGSTPHETIAKDIRTDIDKYGDDSFFTHPSDGMYGLKVPTTFVKAAEIILFAEHQPLHTDKITEIAISKTMIRQNEQAGITPTRSMNQVITQDIANNPNNSTFVQIHPGTYVLRKQIMEKVQEEEHFIRKVTFHPSYSYEEFVEGIRPNLDSDQISYKLEHGIFKDICKQAELDPDNRYVLLIDEINRGNIPKIFGELITLIEDEKREDYKVNLTYSKELFTVPKNLYIIGTMNTADQSISHLDTALRRRFSHEELMPDGGLIDKTIEHNGKKINLKDVLENINEKIKKDAGRERQIGHSYFMKNDEAVSEIVLLRDRFKNKIIPLIQDYFYEDMNKVNKILGDSFIDKTKETVKEETLNDLNAFADAVNAI